MCKKKFFLLIFLSFFFFIPQVFGQIAGDVTNDDIVDASDYLLLRESFTKPLTDSVFDINHDNNVDVADLLIIENFLFRHGAAPSELMINDANASTKLLLGHLDTANSTIHIIIESDKPVGGFQFRLQGVDSIIDVVGGITEEKGMEVILKKNEIFTFQNEGRSVPKGKWDLLKLKFTTNDFKEICLEEPIIVDIDARILETDVGGCISEWWSENGYEKIKNTILRKEFKAALDFNHDGVVNIEDALLLRNLLYDFGNAPIEGEYYEKVRSKIKLTIENHDAKKKKFDIKIHTPKQYASFQFDITGISEILDVSGSELTNVKYNNNRIVSFFNPREKWSENSTLTIYYSELERNTLCLSTPTFINYDMSNFLLKVGSCIDVLISKEGCTDSKASNYDSEATVDNGTCEFNQNQIAVKTTEKEKRERKKDPPPEKTVNKMSEIPIEMSKSKKDKPRKGEKKEGKSEEFEKVKVGEKTLKQVEEELDIDDLEEGVWVVKVTSDQRKKLTKVKKGTMVYDSDFGKFMVYDGKKWRKVSDVKNENTIKYF